MENNTELGPEENTIDEEVPQVKKDPEPTHTKRRCCCMCQYYMSCDSEM